MSGAFCMKITVSMKQGEIFGRCKLELLPGNLGTKTNRSVSDLTPSLYLGDPENVIFEN